jgi:hypothetical protein
VDLATAEDITLWFHCDTLLTGTAADPFRPRIALGSAAMPIGAVGNDWERYLNCENAASWNYAVVSITDLPAPVRGALDTIELQIAATDGAHRLLLDGLEATAPAMVTDVDTALMALLDGQLVLSGTPVPAVIAPDAPASQPAIRLVQYEATRNENRDHTGLRKTDFTDAGHRLRPAPIPWDIFYRIEFDAAARADVTAMQDFVVETLRHRRWLPVGNRAFRIEQVDQVPPDDALIGAPYLRYRVSAWAEHGPAIDTVPVTTTQIDLDVA